MFGAVHEVPPHAGWPRPPHVPPPQLYATHAPEPLPVHAPGVQVPFAAQMSPLPQTSPAQHAAPDVPHATQLPATHAPLVHW